MGYWNNAGFRIRCYIDWCIGDLMETITKRPQRMKIVYNKTVGLDGLVRKDGQNHVAISTDNGNTLSIVHKDDVRNATPIR